MNGITITDDATCVRPQPVASNYDTKLTMFSSVVVGQYRTPVYNDRAIYLEQLMPDLPIGSHGTLEVSVKFTPESPAEMAKEPCLECKLRHTCAAKCTDWEEWMKESKP